MKIAMMNPNCLPGYAIRPIVPEPVFTDRKEHLDYLVQAALKAAVPWGFAGLHGAGRVVSQGAGSDSAGVFKDMGKNRGRGGASPGCAEYADSKISEDPAQNGGSCRICGRDISGSDFVELPE